MYYLHVSLKVVHRMASITASYEDIIKSSNTDHFLSQKKATKKYRCRYNNCFFIMTVTHIQKRKIHGLRKRYPQMNSGRCMGLLEYDWMINSVLKYDHIYTQAHIDRVIIPAEQFKNIGAKKRMQYICDFYVYQYGIPETFEGLLPIHSDVNFEAVRFMAKKLSNKTLSQVNRSMDKIGTGPFVLEGEITDGIKLPGFFKWIKKQKII